MANGNGTRSGGCTCANCPACTTTIRAAVKREAYPPVQRNGIGAAVKAGKR